MPRPSSAFHPRRSNQRYARSKSINAASSKTHTFTSESRAESRVLREFANIRESPLGIFQVFSDICEWHARCNQTTPEADLLKEDMTLRIQRSASDGGVVFTLSGRIQAEHLPDLNNLFELEGADQRIVFDLREVRLVDREAVKFLTQCEDAGARLDNCPAYIREWVWKERKSQCSHEKET